MPQCKKCYRDVRRGVLCYRYGCPNNAPTDNSGDIYAAVAAAVVPDFSSPSSDTGFSGGGGDFGGGGSSGGY